jgi:hypothetical protein
MYDLGYGSDTLYSGVTTRVRTPFGLTAPIAVNRGTIQGDSLSPLLFNLSIEPGQRWLNHAGRGYAPGCLRGRDDALRHALPACAYADDLNIVTSSISNMRIQADKIDAYARWADLRINTSKTTITAALHGSHPQNPYDEQVLRTRLHTVQLGGQPVTFLGPHQPFKFLGIHMTATLNWSHHTKHVKDQIKAKGTALQTSLLSSWRKDLVIKRVIKPAIEYGALLCPYDNKQGAGIDAALAGITKNIYGLPRYTANAFVHAPANAGGIGHTSIRAEMAHSGARNLRKALADAGTLGTWTRALLHAQISNARESRDVAAAQRHSMRLRQLTTLLDAGLEIGRDEPTATEEKELNRDLEQWTALARPLQPASNPRQDPLQGVVASITKPLEIMCEAGLQVQQLFNKETREPLPAPKLRQLPRRPGRREDDVSSAACRIQYTLCGCPIQGKLPAGARKWSWAPPTPASGETARADPTLWAAVLAEMPTTKPWNTITSMFEAHAARAPRERSESPEVWGEGKARRTVCNPAASGSDWEPSEGDRATDDEDDDTNQHPDGRCWVTAAQIDRNAEYMGLTRRAQYTQYQSEQWRRRCFPQLSGKTDRITRAEYFHRDTQHRGAGKRMRVDSTTLSFGVGADARSRVGVVRVARAVRRRQSGAARPKPQAHS